MSGKTLMKRRKARILALQSLYQYEQGQTDMDRLRSFDWEEEELDLEVVSFAIDLVDGVINNLSTIDDRLNDIRQNLQLYRLSEVDKANLRLAIYTLHFLPDIEPPVVINEAIELAKSMSDKNSYKMINRAVEYEASNRGFSVTPKPFYKPGIKPVQKIKIIRRSKKKIDDIDDMNDDLGT